MTQLPSGTVTFLFTDVELSTQTVATVGDEQYADLQDVHRKLLREAFEAHKGVEVGTEGDSFFVAFTHANDAVAAAVDGQRALIAGSPLRVRMGLHTGEALVRGGGYVGHEVHRAKRIADAGHGGQILVSETTADRVGPHVSMTDLGPHRLKDLGEPQRIYQVVDRALPRDFPPLRSLGAFVHSLPPQRSSFVGREREVAEVRELLRVSRIVTVSGVGGCGKTRLAIQVGAEELERFPDGVFFADLAPVSDPAALAREICTAVGAPGGGGAAQVLNANPGIPTEDVLLSYLEFRECLVILDNCEHMLDASADIADQILMRCPKVSILATSREGLRVEGEQSWVVPSLTLPEASGRAGFVSERSGNAIHDSEAVSLFKDRAKAVRPAFELTAANIDAVADICRRLDGIPLAIEFAAARISHLSPQQIADRLDDRFRLLTGGHRRVQRQHTLQAALDWSYEHLTEQERILLRRLSVFHGDFSLEAADGVCSDEQLDHTSITDLLGSLVDKSLVETTVPADEVRYRLLETVRAYAADALARAHETQTFRGRHRDWYADWLCAAPWQKSFMDLRFSRGLWREEANLIAAVEWSVAEDRIDIVGRMGSRIFTQLWSGWDPNLVRRWVALALRSEDQLDPDARVLCLFHTLDPTRFSIADALDISDRCVALSKDASRAAAIYAVAFRSTTTVVVAAMTRNEELINRCYADLDEALRLADGDDGMRVFVLWQRALVDLTLGRSHAAEAPLEEGMRLANASGYVDMEAVFGFYLGLVGHVLGDDERHAEAVTNWRAWADAVRPSFRGGSPVVLIAPMLALRARSQSRSELWADIREARDEAFRSGMPTAPLHVAMGCAVLHVLGEDHRRAALLLSWLRAQTINVGRPIPSQADYILYLRYRDIVRSALGPDEARGVREEGARLSLDEAMELAFGERIRA